MATSSKLISPLKEKTFSVVLIEDHLILREGVREIFNRESDLEVVGEASSAQDGRALTVELAPDLVLLDLAMPGGSGLSIVKGLKAKVPDLRILVLSGQCTDEFIRSALEAGVDGYVLKDAGRAELLIATRAVLGGCQHFCTRVLSHVVSGYLGEVAPSKRDATHSLTNREKEILELVALASTSKEIAAKLSLSAKTVEKHRYNLMRKLQLHNSSAVTLYAIKHKLLVVDVTEGVVSSRASEDDANDR